MLRDQLGEHLAEFGFAVEQPPVEGLLAGRGQRDGVVFALADVQAEEGADATGVDHKHSPVVRSRPHLQAPTLRRTSPPPGGVGGHAPHQRSTSASGSGDTPPDHANYKGELSCRPGGRASHCGADQEGNGGEGVRWRRRTVLVDVLAYVGSPLQAVLATDDRDTALQVVEDPPASRCGGHRPSRAAARTRSAAGVCGARSGTRTPRTRGWRAVVGAAERRAGRWYGGSLRLRPRTSAAL